MPTFHERMLEAVGLQRAGRHEEAARRYRRLLKDRPDDPDLLHLFGMTERDLGRPVAALDWLDRAVRARPDDPAMRANYGTTLSMVARHDAAIEQLDAAVSLAARSAGPAGQPHPGRPGFHANRLLAAQYHPAVTPEELDRLHRDWDRQHAEPVRRHPAARRRLEVDADPDRPLRIGFFPPSIPFHSIPFHSIPFHSIPFHSIPFHSLPSFLPSFLYLILGVHPVGIFLVGLLEHLPRPEFHATAYALRAVDDPLAARLREAADAWVDARALGELDLAARIRADRIDVLFDLAGHTQANRIRTFALRPAPIQATWMGYVGTTGLAEMDLLVADPHQVRPEDEPAFRERVVRLPHDYVIFDPPAADEAPAVGPLPAASRGHLTFGCFNNPSKLNEPLLDTWAAVLAAVPGSRLRLKYRGFGDPGLQSWVREAFATRGIAADRLQLEGRSPRAELLAAWGAVDIALDPHPYSGGLTTMEALWMGVPVLTRPGRTFASRHSLTHLMAVGLESCVAADEPDFVARAVDLAGDLDRLAGLRAELRDRVRASPLCDAAGYARDVAALIRREWRSWCEQNAAAGGQAAPPSPSPSPSPSPPSP